MTPRTYCTMPIAHVETEQPSGAPNLWFCWGTERSLRTTAKIQTTIDAKNSTLQSILQLYINCFQSYLLHNALTSCCNRASECGPYVCDPFMHNINQIVQSITCKNLEWRVARKKAFFFKGILGFKKKKKVEKLGRRALPLRYR